MTDGRAPSGPGSREPSPSVSAAIGFDPSRYHVGQRLWYVPASRFARAESALISKVGRKWATVTCEKHGREIGRVEIGKDLLDGGDWAPPGRLYGSEADFEESAALNLMWQALQTTMRHVYRRPHHMTRCKLETILRLLRDSDGSGEADETGTGSAEGDSASPQDIAQSTPTSED